MAKASLESHPLKWSSGRNCKVKRTPRHIKGEILQPIVRLSRERRWQVDIARIAGVTQGAIKTILKRVRQSGSPNSNTGARIVRCTLSSDSVLSENSRLFKRYSVSANEISYDEKNSQSNCVFKPMLVLEENYSPPPLGDFNRLFEGQIGVLFKIWQTGEFPAQMASNAEKVSIWWRHHGNLIYF